MNDKNPASLGFEDELTRIDTQKTPASTPGRRNIDPDIVREVAENAGFQSRDPAPKKGTRYGKSDQINIRANVSVLTEFRRLGSTQEPRWPLGYTFERAIAALKRELET